MLAWSQNTKWSQMRKGNGLENDKHTQLLAWLNEMYSSFATLNEVWAALTKDRLMSNEEKNEKKGPNRGSNPGPLAPKARIIPLNHSAAL